MSVEPVDHSKEPDLYNAPEPHVPKTREEHYEEFRQKGIAMNRKERRRIGVRNSRLNKHRKR